MILVRIIVFLLGAFLVWRTIHSAIRTFVLPRGARDKLTARVFITIRSVITFIIKHTEEFEAKDRVMAWFSPISLMALLPVWYTLITLGYTAMFWAMGVDSLYDAFVLSGSSLLTFGFATADNLPQLILVYTEGTIGLLMVALLIGYLPTIYQAFSRREFQVTRFEVRAGSPPSPVEFILRHSRIARLDELTPMWQAWEEWFADVEETHTSLASLVFFRSPQMDKSWVTTGGCVLDSAALLRSMVDVPPDTSADICIRAGYLCFRRIADYFNISYNPDPRFPTDSISITREEFDRVYDLFGQYGVPLRDPDQAWHDFGGWRVNYDRVLIALCKLTMAPPAMWSTDRYDMPADYDPLASIMARWHDDG